MSRKLMLILIIMLFTLQLIFTGCSSWLDSDIKPAPQNTKNSSFSTTADYKTIGFSVAGFSTPYFRVLIDYAKLEAIKQGVELKVLDAEWDINKQKKQMKDLIDQKVDAICIIPIDSKQIIPTLKLVKAAGIPLIDVNVQNDPDTNDIIDTFVGASMEEEATFAAESILKLLGEKGGNVIILEGPKGNFAAIHRTLGFEEVIRKNSNIHIIARAYTDWDMIKAEKAMEGFLTKYKRIDAVYAHDDNIAIGAIQAIKKAGRAGEFPIAAISGNIEGYEAVKRGEIYSTVSQPPDWEGTTAIRVAIKLMNGEKVDKWVKTPVKPVTRDNVSSFKGIW
jgi:ABC-type sugar transport system substrate-binding protein